MVSEELPRDNVRAIHEWLALNPGHEWHVEARRYLEPEHVVATVLPVAVEVERHYDLGVVVDRLARDGKLG